MKDAARLLAFLAATLLFGALAAPILYWSAQKAADHGVFPILATFDFETFFHRALLIGALLFFWPLLRSLRIRNLRELGLVKNKRAWQHAFLGFFSAAIPLLCLGGALIALHVYQVRPSISLTGIAERTLSALVVPFLEEPLFRGLILGALLRTSGPTLAVFLSSAFFSILHFLKAPEHTSAVVTWLSGFVSIGNSFSQFTQPLLLAAGFTTLFLLGWILASARLRTNSLWLPIGLHAGWIFASAVFNKIARQEIVALPWLGKSLLIGIVPLCVALLTWGIWRVSLRLVDAREV